MIPEIIVIGLGPGSPDALSIGALRALHSLQTSGSPIFSRTLRHPTVDWLADEEGIEFTASFDALYESRETFDDVYSAIVESLIAEANRSGTVGFAVPGHPSFGEKTVALLRESASASQIIITQIASASYLDAVLQSEAVGDVPLRVLDALDLIRPVDPFLAERDDFDSSALHVIYQIYDRHIASELKLALLETFPPETPVVVVSAAGVPGREMRTERELSELDRAGVEFDHLTSLLIRPLPRPEQITSYRGLLSIMAHLRNPVDGCPWDLQQTKESLRPFLLEEAYEVADAIDQNSFDSYAEELGDLLLQVAFHAQLAREAREFTMRDVIGAITSKLIRRHPHVFGNVEVADADHVLRNWAQIKKSEPGYEDRKSILDGVPLAMPALMRAQEISKRAAKAGFEWDSIEGVFDKLAEEVVELKEAIKSGDRNAVYDELGDLLFTAVNLARFEKADAELSLNRMIEKFSKRFRRIEDHASMQGKTINELTQSDMEQVWQVAKRE